MDPVDIDELQTAWARKQGGGAYALELMDCRSTALGIGAQGLGGLTTVLDVKIKDYPTHAASLPVGHDSQLCRHPACPF